MDNVNAEIFLKYHFSETKDLLKAFITLISATLVFSIAFAEKVINFQDSNQASRSSLFSCWVFLIVAIVLSGLSVCSLALAGGAAVYGNSNSISSDVVEWAALSNLFALIAGAAFVVALILMVAAAVYSDRKKL